ncbi:MULTISPECIES: peptidoglycan-binding protein [unclassified Pseudomonas]|uniref:peptidoglycan-binding protein n=1 Tax=unclassified Pseudomonas TaxID=196821 RepID=UPI000C8692D9|nr:MULTISPECIES: peptidoglycan-binding protein [unclassified Pseudomonas]PMU26817.1 peptidoglycan-binding protein [Pseudomonas sp. GP01-A9]PMU32387.1 peptidoglycan-binding protein [Pseudomonas sp. GP01-A13]PMU44610.1 peptidoglycan-binding protein [Pseudomonas sp. GP01-A8]PMU51748.1 peptidoglycan-binding protein [Pseudomonas sp. GP01-A14]PMU53724.1 peptidoglycan-binding protein [Pseudomonas sp. GP01-A6]
MRKSLLVLLLWAQAVIAQVPESYPQPGQPLPLHTQQAIQRFLLHNRILDTPQELEHAPYIVAADAGRVLGADGERIYARGALNPTAESYGIFRRGKAYTDPQSQELLGINVDDIGTARFVTAGDVSTLGVQRVTQEVRPGDRLLSQQAPTDLASLVIQMPARATAGHIIDVPRGVTQIGVLDAVTLNKGRRDGLTEGHLLAVVKTGETVRDRVTGALVKMPDEPAGTLLVFRTYEKLSYGLVLSASRSLAVMDRFEAPERRQ